MRPDYYCEEVFSIIQYFIEDYEILYYTKMKEFVNIEGFDSHAFMSYLILKKDYKKIKQLLTLVNNYSIDIIYTIVAVDIYWDGVIINKYEEYKIKNTENYMYFLFYLKLKLIDIKFINDNVLKFLTNDYQKNIEKNIFYL